jgi:hypothetical protein
MRTILRTGVRALRLIDRVLEVLIFDLLLAPRRRAWVLGAAAIGGALLLWAGTARSPERGLASDAAGMEAKNLLFERPWLDHLPKDEHDRYNALIFNHEGVGATVNASAYRGQWELFLFKVKDNKLQVLFPHDKRRAATSFKISPVRHKTFDLELRLEDPPVGPKSLYSWKKFRHGDLDAQPLRDWVLERLLLPANGPDHAADWPSD